MSEADLTETASHRESDGRRSFDGLLTTRVIDLHDLLRRSGTMANRRELDLSYMDWRIMAQVGEHAPLSLNDLADLLTLDRGQVSRAVKALVGRDLLRSTRRPKGYSIEITLSDRGKTLHDRMVDLIRERHRFLVEGLAQAEIDETARVLDQLAGRARLLLERERAMSPSPEGGSPA